MTLPSIPDNIYKLLLLVGIFCIGYGYIEDLDNDKTYFSKVDAFNSSIDSLDIELMKVDHQRDRLKRTADFLSKRYNIKNPVSENDSTIFFNQIISGEKIQMAASDSLARLWDSFKENQFKIELFNKQLQVKKEALKDAKVQYDLKGETNFWINMTGGICLLMGFIGMLWIQGIQDDLLKRQLEEKPRVYKYCQSCGKKFSSIRLASKNSDGTINSSFCSECYDNGHFVEPDLTRDEFKRRAKIEVAKRKTWLGRKLLSARLNNLERWDVDNYF